MEKRITVYETHFSTPEVMAMYIVDYCPCDCYECMMPNDIPCYREFGITTDQAEKYYSEILEWLNSPYGSRWE